MGSISSIRIFGFLANWSPFFLVAIIFTTIVFFLITGRWRHDIPGNRPLKRSEAVTFIICMFLLYAMKGAPVDLLSHIIFSFHMLQMAILYLLIVPLLFFAIPEYLIDYCIKLPIFERVFNFLTRPIIALITFNGLFSIYHIPAILDGLKQNATLHSLFTILLFITAFFMWYPIFNKTALERKQLSGLVKIGYIFAIGVLLTPACGLIIFASHAMYKTYTDPAAWMSAMSLCVPTGTLQDIVQNSSISGPQYFTNMTPKEDQQTGGVIMKVLQEIFFGFMLFHVFFRWSREERMSSEEITQRSLEEKLQQDAYFNQYR
ncbi:cytochrome c oxidase assembly factor CtaG [Macrococcoides caseolyticum]|uniref:cytochrome c oxidase assembly factor CtaG n=1 Tax=Macrococcoides caseolyticum TaxID=69966 RepID=UPI001C5FDEDF|nr:cytochrome c oxidase assembly factor CtaG [Macrococcus caseolyticus]QYA40804.1 cytochrome c oxidase assembly factor CtaG [Macrococcus caseolyticus]